MFKVIDPYAKIRSIEPCKEDYEKLKRLGDEWGFRTYNFALGDGNNMCFGRHRQGTHKFYTEADKQWWPKVPEYFVESKTIAEIFEYFHIRARYIVKVDCEGGERFILNDEKSIPLIGGAVQFNIELHKFGGAVEAWTAWFENFKDTHCLYKRTTTREHDEKGQDIYHEIDAPDSNNQKEYMLVKK
jgi:FkbM family methyltransferase